METVLGFFTDVWEKKACVLSKAGWLDAEGNVDDAALMEDISTLPPALSVGLKDTRDLCMNRSMDATLENVFSSPEFGAKANLGGDKDMEKCEPKIDPEELLEVEIVLQKLAFFRCVHENFMDGCGNYILEAVQSMIEQGMSTKTSTAASPMTTTY